MPWEEPQDQPETILNSADKRKELVTNVTQTYSGIITNPAHRAEFLEVRYTCEMAGPLASASVNAHACTRAVAGIAFGPAGWCWCCDWGAMREGGPCCTTCFIAQPHPTTLVFSCVARPPHVCAHGHHARALQGMQEFFGGQADFIKRTLVQACPPHIITPSPFFKMAQHLDLRSVLHPAP